ncbi:MAG: cyclic pyranopterin monophosphate synthase MoaC, partial [Phycisphaerales bacterium]|nr:cyclic pyranopterin monophosphate synthase MoaC [Phycisphaerales bacterium]
MPDRNSNSAAADQRLTHLDDAGRARMVDVSEKAVSARRAVAEAVVRMAPATLDAIIRGQAPKGDVLAAARIAGIQAAKRTSDLIPLCHPLPIDAVEIAIEAAPPEQLRILATCIVEARTVVEMEALTAASVA